MTVTTIALTVMLAGATGADDSAAVAFRDRVAHVLSTRCLTCHNGTERKGEFSLERREDALASGHIDPGKPDESSLLSAIIAHDGKPPAMPKNAQPLKAEDVQAIREWIAAGAAWPDGFVLTEPAVKDFGWWSYQPVVRSIPPQFAADSGWSNWVRTPIDAFVAKTLIERKLSHSGEADRTTLIRRLSFDLLGLPPTPEEVDQFLNDADPLAYERLVDRMLESPHYGERWARHWLDVVKYADTCGYDKDKLRPNAWPYRDYVVRSFNDDKPYARFVQEQLAGDVLFPGQPDGILGLGFIAAGPWDFIGHVEVPESKIDGKIARHTDRDEMVSNTLNTFCSVTIQCAQCHNHKFDPITQQHYYNLQSVFAAVDRADRPYDLDPEIESQRQRLQLALAAAESRLRDLEAAMERDGGPELVAVEARIRELTPRAEPVAKKAEYGYHSGIEPAPDREKWVQVDLGRPVDISRVILHPRHDEFAGIGAGFGFPPQYRILTANDEAAFGTTGCAQSAAVTEGTVSHHGIIPVEIPMSVGPTRYVRVLATKLAERQQDFIFALAELEVIDRDGNNIASRAAVTSLDSIEAPARWGRVNLTDGIWPKSADEAAAAELAKSYEQREQIHQRVRTPERVAERKLLVDEISSTKTLLAQLPAGRMVYAAASQFEPQGSFQPTRGIPRVVKVLHRGNIQQPVAETTLGTIPLPGLPEQFVLPPGAVEGDARAALAQWITRLDNPLTWRSVVNRVWQYHFGRGLVDSSNDFGRMGKEPTHPELLDWLAADFRDNGMSFKRLHRVIMTSAVYRQASTHNGDNAAIDGDNRFLWRMNRRRLEAEEVRDAMLAASSRLNTDMGGPGYYLFVLERPEHSPHYEYDKFDMDDPTTHRRSLYRFIVRSQPDPYMTTLDCADSSQSTPQRNETLTALQALSLLNNQFSLAISKRFASEVDQHSGSDEEKVSWAFRRTIGHEPTDVELRELTDFAKQRGWPNLCRVLFNLSEFVFVD
jgi:hypothetical protein